MSRTVRGTKPPGFDYWTARPFNKCGGRVSTRGGKYHKRRTHKAERRLSRKDLENLE